MVPQPPGGGFDTVARLLAERLGSALGHAVIVENRTGAGTLVGTEAVAKATPDGENGKRSIHPCRRSAKLLWPS